MDSDQYKAQLGKLRERSVSNLSELAGWGISDALPWLWRELAGIVGRKKLSAMRPYNAIRQGLQTTPLDRIKMPTLPSFYVAQLTMLDSEAKRYCAAATSFYSTSEPLAGNAALVNLHGALIDLFS